MEKIAEYWGLLPKNNRKRKKLVPNFKFAEAFGFFGIFLFELRQKFEPFENHVTSEVLRGQELTNTTLNIHRTLQMPYKSLISLK